MSPLGAPRVLRVLHRTRYNYESPVELAHHVAHLRPRDTAWQRVEGWALDIQPPPDGVLQQGRDAFGNWRQGFSHARVHQHLQVDAAFTAHLAPAAPLLPQDSPPWEAVAAQLRYRAGAVLPPACEFTLASPLAPCGAEFAQFAGALFTPGRPLLDAALALSAHINACMQYRPSSTSVATGSAHALAQGQGVCQDFAHIALSVLRTQGLAAAYVSGYLLTETPEGQPRLQGADASHAWFSVWCPQHGWVALDPTNHLVVGQQHVTLAWGRDYGDVAPLRGVIRGGGTAQPEVQVTVTRG